MDTVLYNREMTIHEYIHSRKNDNSDLGYQEIIEKTAPVDILCSEDIGSYQGETYVLLFNRVTYKYGYLNYSFGSCYVCDWWQSVEGDSEGELDLRNSLWSDIKWMSKKESLEFFSTQHPHWQASHYYNNFDAHDTFKRAVIEHKNKYVQKT